MIRETAFDERLHFGDVAGVLADRFDRRRIMLVSDLASFATLIAFSCAIAWNRQPPVWLILANSFVLCTARALFMPAASAISCMRALPAGNEMIHRDCSAP